MIAPGTWRRSSATIALKPAAASVVGALGSPSVTSVAGLATTIPASFSAEPRNSPMPAEIASSAISHHIDDPLRTRLTLSTRNKQPEENSAERHLQE